MAALVTICERLGGSSRRECLDFLIPFNEPHLRAIIRLWATHYNRCRPHSSLGLVSRNPPRTGLRTPAPAASWLPRWGMAVLGGLHHEHSLVKEGA
jgi:transposase InsO family protein